MKKIVLDSFSLVALYRKEKSGIIVKQYLLKAKNNQCQLFFSFINLAEFYYKIIRESSLERAEKTLSNLKQLPIALVSASDDLVLASAKVKAKYPISLADCFAVALAQKHKAVILTGDPEFKKVEDIVKIEWM